MSTIKPKHLRTYPFGINPVSRKRYLKRKAYCEAFKIKAILFNRKFSELFLNGTLFIYICNRKTGEYTYKLPYLRYVYFGCITFTV